MGTATVDPRDLLADRRLRLALWGVPQGAFLLGFFLAAHRIILWVASLTVLGSVCLLNAARCRRLHCTLTGPFFLVMAGATYAYCAGWLALGPRGWLWLGFGTVIVGNLLAAVPERLWGTYLD